MAGRPKNPETDYKIFIHRATTYRYAATQPYIMDEKTGAKKRRYIYWGNVSEDLKFTPNERYLLATPEERNKLIFPSEWDLSAIEKLKENPNVSVYTYIENDGQAFSGTVSVSSSDDQFNNRFYGGPWFLWQLAVNKHVVEDLLEVFNYDYVAVNDIMTLAMFPILTKMNYNQVERWQSYTKTPSTHALSPSFITRFSQKITDDHRMRFLKLRIARQDSGAVVACDSTTRSGYGKCLADIRWGNNKDNKDLPNTLEVVVYSLDTHEPIYYRTFAGNESDSRTLRTITKDLKELGCKDLTIILDRGYETEDNILNMIQQKQPFLVCGKVGQKPVYDSIEKVKFDSDGLPTNMEYYAKENIYTAQLEEKITLSKEQNESDSETTATLKINLFLDAIKRTQELIVIKNTVHKEQTYLEEYVKTYGKIDKSKLHDLRKECPNFKFVVDKDTGEVSYSLNEDKVDKAKSIAGFFASISYLVEGTAQEQMELYALRDEQEKYFEEMKDQLGFSLQRNSSEDGKAGRLLILFIGLILHSTIRHTWSSSLKKKYPSSVDVLHEMIPIRFVEYPDGTSHVTGFTTPQIEICEAFELPVPDEFMSSTQKKAYERKKLGRKRGRPKGSVNKKKKTQE